MRRKFEHDIIAKFMLLHSFVLQGLFEQCPHPHWSEELSILIPFSQPRRLPVPNFEKKAIGIHAGSQTTNSDMEKKEKMGAAKAPQQKLAKNTPGGVATRTLQMSACLQNSRQPRSVYRTSAQIFGHSRMVLPRWIFGK